MPLSNPMFEAAKAAQAKQQNPAGNADAETFDNTWVANIRGGKRNSPYAVLKAAGATDEFLQAIIDNFLAANAISLQAQQTNAAARLEALQASMTDGQKAILEQKQAAVKVPEDAGGMAAKAADVAVTS